MRLLWVYSNFSVFILIWHAVSKLANTKFLNRIPTVNYFSVFTSKLCAIGIWISLQIPGKIPRGTFVEKIFETSSTCLFSVHFSKLNFLHCYWSVIWLKKLLNCEEYERKKKEANFQRSENKVKAKCSSHSRRRLPSHLHKEERNRRWHLQCTARPLTSHGVLLKIPPGMFIFNRPVSFERNNLTTLFFLLRKLVAQNESDADVPSGWNKCSCSCSVIIKLTWIRNARCLFMHKIEYTKSTHNAQLITLWLWVTDGFQNAISRTQRSKCVLVVGTR